MIKTINFGITNYKGLALDSGTHFFGTPVVTPKLAKVKFEKQEMFIGQINFKDLASLSPYEKCPKAGMLYIFYDLFAHTYSAYYYKEEGTVELDGFNEKFNITGRFTSPLQLIFSVAEGAGAYEYGDKMFAELPQMVKDLYPKYKSGYRSVIQLCPVKLDYFEKSYLTGVKNYSLAIVSEKDLLKNKFDNIVTINI